MARSPSLLTSLYCWKITSVNDHATDAERRIAYEAGYLAFGNDESRAPSLSETMRTLIGSTPVGAPRTRELFIAYTDGFDQAGIDWLERTTV